MAVQTWCSHSFVIVVCLVLVLELSQGVSSIILVGLRNNRKNNNQNQPKSASMNGTSCALFTGSWVHDESYPVYQYLSCPLIDIGFNCQLYGRADTDYLKYRWKPENCELPRFNGADFVTRMRGKTVMFVGDSLGRNQWESLICMILAGIPSGSPTQINRGDPFSSFKFLDYGVSISFYRAPYLVDIVVMQGKRILKLDDVSGNANAWKNADVLVFNTGHWWTHTGSLQGWDYMESEGSFYEDMDRLVALEKGLRTWANFVDTNIDSKTKRVFFQGVSPTHYNPREWNVEGTSKSCYGETVPTSGSTYPGAYPNQMTVINKVINDMNAPPYLLDITTLSAMRKDAHPSIYTGDLSPEQRSSPDHHSVDCSHWCLPGLPDTWNQLFYTALFF